VTTAVGSYRCLAERYGKRKRRWTRRRSMADEAVAAETTAHPNRKQNIMAVKLAVGILVGLVMTGVVGPIVLAIIVGLATGHH
jgi:F0F1-type ATP synthase assembly protein I